MEQKKVAHTYNLVQSEQKISFTASPVRDIVRVACFTALLPQPMVTILRDIMVHRPTVWERFSLVDCNQTWSVWC